MTAGTYLRMAAVLAALAPCVPSAWSQTLYGSLVGNVTDPSGAAVPGAKISAVNDETGFTRETLANERGIYSFSDLHAGRYTVSVNSAAFAAFTQRGVLISNNAVVRVDV